MRTPGSALALADTDSSEASMRQVRQHEVGGPETLRVDDVPVPQPGPGELLVQSALIGTGLAAVRHSHGERERPLPDGPGGEVVGRVAAVGEDVSGWQVGQRVSSVVFGPAYAEQVVVPAALATEVPDDVDDATAVAICRGGQVALGAARAARIAEGDRVLVTAALSGVGHLAVQIAGLLGAAQVIGAVSSLGKVSPHGQQADVVTYDYLAELDVDVVLDGVGGEVGSACLSRLSAGGRHVVFSAAGFTIDSDALRAGGRSVIGFTMAHVARDRRVYHERARELLAWAAVGRIVVSTHPERFALRDAAQAHRLILGRANHGKVLLDPNNR